MGDATAICGRGVQTANLAVLPKQEGSYILPPLSIRTTLANHDHMKAHVCGGVCVALSLLVRYTAPFLVN